MKSWFYVGTIMISLVGCTREPMREKARDMFREPSSEEQGKIPEKFQPIDHKIDKAQEEEAN